MKVELRMHCITVYAKHCSLWQVKNEFVKSNIEKLTNRKIFFGSVKVECV